MIAFSLTTFAVGGLNSFTLDLEEPQDCTSEDEAVRKFWEGYTSPDGLLSFFDGLGDQCRVFLRTNNTFIKEVRYALTIVSHRFDYPDRLNSGDLDTLKELSALIGESPTQEQIQKYNQQMKKVRTNCTAKDQRAKLPPVRDQDSIGWCYSYTAADLVSFKSGINVSAIDLAINYNNSTEARVFGDRLSLSLGNIIGP